tara:strand:+ start:105 stop:314 length:210 start_codon:yes stop_codon:yes gene_type:complete
VSEKVQIKEMKEVLEPATPSPTKEASHQVATQIPSHHRSQQLNQKSSKRRSTCLRKNENIENTFMEFFN